MNSLLYLVRLATIFLDEVLVRLRSLNCGSWKIAFHCPQMQVGFCRRPGSTYFPSVYECLGQHESNVAVVRILHFVLSSLLVLGFDTLRFNKEDGSSFLAVAR